MIGTPAKATAAAGTLQGGWSFNKLSLQCKVAGNWLSQAQDNFFTALAPRLRPRDRLLKLYRVHSDKLLKLKPRLLKRAKYDYSTSEYVNTYGLFIMSTGMF